MTYSHYENTEVKIQKGGKIVRNVTIKNGKGYKSVNMYKNGKKVKTIKKKIPNNHIYQILQGKFIPGLFSDCNCKREKNKTRKNTKG